MKWLSLVCILIFHVSASAHVLDEYVQAAQIAVSLNGVRVELRLTPGVEVADRVFAMIDKDRNGRISKTEEDAYGQRVFDDVALEIDGYSESLILTSVHFPSRTEMKAGDSAIRFDFTADFAATPARVHQFAPGDHRLTFRNNHLPELAVYQANALIPTTDAIAITGQQRDPLQHEFQMNFRVLSPAHSTATTAPASPRRTGTFWIATVFGTVVLLIATFLTLRRRQELSKT